VNQFRRLAEWRAIYPSPQDVFTIHDFERVYSSIPHEQPERDLVAQQFVLQEIEKVISERYRQRLQQPRHLVVFIDEAGPCPTFVRAMCSCYRDLETAISHQFSYGTCTVSLILAGTGIEGAEHSVGSEHRTTYLCHVRPDVWSVLKQTLPSQVTDVLDNNTSTLVRIVNGMLQNARVAAMFAVAIENLANPKQANLVVLDPVQAVRNAALTAAHFYRRANIRGSLSKAADFALMLRAMAQQTLFTEQSSLSQYGLLVDRARKMLIADANQALRANKVEVLPIQCGSEEAVCLSTMYLGVRYEVEIAQTTMLQLVLQIGDQQVTSRSFQPAGADFTAMAMELSRKELGMNFDFFKNTPPWEMPHGWSAPLMLAQAFRRSSPPAMVSRYWRKETPCDVDIVTSLKALEPPKGQASRMDEEPPTASDSDSDSEAVRRPSPWEQLVTYIDKDILGHLNKARLGTVVTNCGTTSFADVIAFFRTTDLVLISTKLYMEKKLSVRDVFEELHKMGNRDWRSVLAKWHSSKVALPDTAPSWLRGKLATRGRNQFIECIENEPPADQGVKGWLASSMYGFENPLTARLKAATKRPHGVTQRSRVLKRRSGDDTDSEGKLPEPELSGDETGSVGDPEQPGGGSKPSGRRVTYVIMSYGTQPAAIPVTLNLTDDAPAALRDAVRLLLAPDLHSTERWKVVNARREVARAARGVVPEQLLAALSGTTVDEDLSVDQRAQLRDVCSALSVPNDVLLLYAPNHAGQPTAGSFAAEQLWGYYPIIINPPLSASHRGLLRPHNDVQ
jgi:hypothetical protein